jgi:hypothetical protein
VAAATKRQDRWQKGSKTAHARTGTKSSKHSKHVSGKMRGFQKLEADGAALIKRIDAKCGVTNSAG